MMLLLRRYFVQWDTRWPSFADLSGVVTAPWRLRTRFNGQSEHRAGHLYTVSFTAAELWSEAKNSVDRVLVDLWEEYFEPA